MNDYEIISDPEGDYSHSVLVPEHSDETRQRAAKVLVQHDAEPWDENTEAEAIDMLAAEAIAVSFTQHASEPTDEQGCGCEAVGWWCESPGNGGATRDFWSFDWGDIEDAREHAERAPDNPGGGA
jgi:hypothetical protein